MELPKHYERFTSDFPGIAEAYEKLGEAVHKTGPLNDKQRALVKLAISVGAGSEGAVHSATRKALEAGIMVEEIRHAVLLAIPTIGFPASMAALSWVNDICDNI